MTNDIISILKYLESNLRTEFIRLVFCSQGVVFVVMFWFVITPQDSAVNSHCLEAVCGLTDLCCFDWGVVTGPHLSIQFTDHRSYNPHSKGVYSRDEPLLPIAPHLCSNLTSQCNIQKDPNGNPMLSLNELHRILSKRLPLTDISVFRIPVTSASRFYFTA